MSINYANVKNTLKTIAGGGTLNENMRTEYIGGVQLLYNSQTTGEIHYLKDSIHKYTYLDIVFKSTSDDTKSKVISYPVSLVQTSSSSNIIRYYDPSECNFNFYNYDGRTLYFTKLSNCYIYKIYGVKYSDKTMMLNNSLQNINYYDGTELTGMTWNTGDAVLRTNMMKTIQTNYTSSFSVQLNTIVTDIIDIDVNIISPSGENYSLPYFDENGNTISMYVYNNTLYITLKGITISSNSILNLTIDYIL